MMALCLVLQLAPTMVALADSVPSDLTGQTDYLVIHTTAGAYPDQGGPSSIVVKDTSDNQIYPTGGTYADIPAGSSIALTYVFHLEDGDGETLYEYTGGNYSILRFPRASRLHARGQAANVYATDTSQACRGCWHLVVTGTADFGRSDRRRGRAQRHVGMIRINGTLTRSARATRGDDHDAGTETVTFVRRPRPRPPSHFQKPAFYDAAKNAIT
jgi:hypothetical protein